MTKQIFKMILIGILAGVALFMVPFFLLKVLVFFLIIGAICRLWWGGRRRGGWGGYHFAYADKIRNMNEEEYKTYKEKMNSSSCNYYNHCGGYYNNCGDWNCGDPSTNAQEEKKDLKTENKNESSNNQ